ncbi:protein NLRC3-like protein, partial [Lates japonicus]
MAQRKKRKLSDFSSSSPFPLTPEQPASICSEPSVSSQQSETESTAPSLLSMKSDVSKYQPLNFGVGSSQQSESESTAPTPLSMKSDVSKYQPLNFGTQSSQQSETESTASSDVSMKSDVSKYQPLNFGGGSQLTGELHSCSVCEEDSRDPVKLTCGHWSCKQCLGSDWDSLPDYPCPKCGKKHRKDPEHQRDTEDTGDSHLLKAKKDFKEEMKKKFTLTSE